ncbi:UTP--glucose-1-phosphate uridylyltransferase [Bacillus canaveralius]|uniref:UTP--glucose-1-phosphate uridylyltransferase n=1 Tax=Bacillus canaveralius TaxID=1403243 RepID=A0A2N5GKW1_9BACI|nr:MULTISPECIES: UTP--glucose-1-phosphate uridylyltransferase [Bacillus]PLR82109.1 UTP--glucose-1-phosphate uridylyltransferase [Bacillus canaveralius]PLR83936.1 UTP--glucose-1-phosphate uridylyltransferase [Bacillus sp. V33-4]PLR97985.1 UTP--glucose-1-phosphate uridylyltransferase [Bacillus canaveralius]RSK54434.1 UTP--glucose-1-phosphate uridylyltransferase [Bacillus canaveralius]
MIRKAIIPAAGYGTRSLPITKVIPKEMFPVGVKPAIHYVVDEAFRSGVDQILIVVSKRKNLIVDYFDHSLELEAFLERENKQHLLDQYTIPDGEIYYTRQPYAKGLGDAIRIGEKFIGDEPFAVLLPDDIILEKGTPGLKQLIDDYTRFRSSIIGLNKVEPHLLSSYGVVKGTEIEAGTYKLDDIVEKPKQNPPSNLAVLGRYIFTPAIFRHLAKLTPGAGGEIQLTDAIKSLLKSEKCLGKIIAGQRFDIGSNKEYIKLQNLIGNSPASL